MRIELRLVFSVMLVVAVTVGILQIDPTWAASAARNIASLPQNWLWLREVSNEQSRVGDLCQQMQARVARKNEIIQAVRERRLSLHAAVAQFLEASQNCWYEWDYESEEHPEWSRQKRCAQIIVDSVGIFMEADKSGPDETLHDLQAEVVAWTDD
jgi:hypothetical protein